MPTIRTQRFGGIVPRLHPTLLPDEGATLAHNCVLFNGKIVPIREPLQVADMPIVLENGLTKIADAKTVYLWDRGFRKDILAWPGVVHVSKSNLANDPRKRLFVSGETGFNDADEPCLYISSLSGAEFTRHRLYKETLAAPVVTLDAYDPDKTIRYTSFFQTWVDEFGYESGASLPGGTVTEGVNTEEVIYNDGQDVAIASVTAPQGAVARRIYKVVTGTETDQIQFMAEGPRINESFPTINFTIKDEDAGEVIEHVTTIPIDLTSMVSVPGNFFAGFRRDMPREVCFSDMDRPASWPDAFRYTIKDDAIALAVAGNTVFVLTKRYPWAITGTDPGGMAASVIVSDQACVSPRSVCTMEGRVFYASQDGICMLAEGSANAVLITRDYFSKTNWVALNPSTCLMNAYDGMLFAWFIDAGGIRRGYILSIGDGISAVTTHDEYAKASFVDVETDGLYFVREV